MAIFRFVSWQDETGAIVGTTPSLTLFIDKDKILTANYEEIPMVITAEITRFEPPAEALAGETLNIPIQIENTGTEDVFDANIDLYDAETGDLLYHSHKSNFLVGQVANFTASIVMPNINLPLRLELSIQPSPVDVFTVVDTKTAIVTLVAPPTYKLTISSTVGGTTDPPSGTYEYDEGTTVTVTAISDEEYLFHHWELDGATRTGTQINVLMNQDHTLLAVFSLLVPRGCFIATATYGTPLAPQLKTLRKFRDRCLPKQLTNFYYAHSPPVAEYIRRHSNVRRTVRFILEQVIKTIRGLLK